MKRPFFQVDFNELLEPNLVALSASDTREAVTGENVTFSEGLAVGVYEDDIDDAGEPNYLVATGIAERHFGAGWTKRIKWCCRVDDKGIRHESDLV